MLLTFSKFSRVSVYQIDYYSQYICTGFSQKGEPLRNYFFTNSSSFWIGYIQALMLPHFLRHPVYIYILLRQVLQGIHINSVSRLWKVSFVQPDLSISSFQYKLGCLTCKCDTVFHNKLVIACERIPGQSRHKIIPQKTNERKFFAEFKR